MSPLRPRNVSPCHPHIHPQVDSFTAVDSGFPGRPVSHTVFYRYHYSSGNFRHWFFHVVFSPGAVGIHATFGVVRRIVFRSLLWFASLGLFTGHGHSHRTHSRFSPTPGTLYPGSVWRRYSYLARQRISLLASSFHFSIYFLSSMCQYHRLISTLHAFATSHHASYFGSRDIGSV